MPKFFIHLAEMLDYYWTWAEISEMRKLNVRWERAVYEGKVNYHFFIEPTLKMQYLMFTEERN